MTTSWRDIPQPFERLRWSTIAALEEFEDALRKQRSIDQDLDRALHVNSVRWMKQRNEEVNPVRFYARHLRLPNSTRYRLTEEGAAHDVDLETGQCVLHLQVTTAGPIWQNGHRNWGVDQALQMEQLNRDGEQSGWGPYNRQPDRTISNRDAAILAGEIELACLKGLCSALVGKRDHRAPDCHLIVHACAYNEYMSAETFHKLAAQSLAHAGLEGFRSLNILSSGDEFYCHRR